MEFNQVYEVMKSVPTASGRSGRVRLSAGDLVKVVNVRRDGNVDVQDLSNNRIIKNVSCDHFMDTNTPSSTNKK